MAEWARLSKIVQKLMLKKFAKDFCSKYKIQNNVNGSGHLLIHFQKWCHFRKCKKAQNDLKSFPRISKNDTFESVRIKSVRVDAHYKY